MPEAGQLTERQRELLRAFVDAWEASEPGAARQWFVFGHGPLDHPNWPEEVLAPQREEVRGLVHLGYLTPVREKQPDWVVFPSPSARELFSSTHDQLADALSNADRRLGVILEATVEAYEADPSRPVFFGAMDQIDIVDHPGWPTERDVVRRHDLAQLEDMGLVGLVATGVDSFEFWPTATGRQAIHNPAALLDEKAAMALEPAEESRFRKWVERFRAGEFAVSTIAGTASGMLIRVLVGH